MQSFLLTRTTKSTGRRYFYSGGNSEWVSDKAKAFRFDSADAAMAKLDEPTGSGRFGPNNEWTPQTIRDLSSTQAKGSRFAAQAVAA